MGTLKYIYASCCDGNQFLHKDNLCYKCWHKIEYSNNIEYREEWDKKNEIRKQRAKVWRDNNRERLREKNRASAAKRRKSLKYRIQVQEKRLNVEYELSGEQYRKMIVHQLNKCKICHRKGTITETGGTTLVIDHDHQTGEIRGLLCNSCNVYIARIDADKDSLKRLYQYFKKKFPVS